MPEKAHPFFFVMKSVLAANGTGTASYSVASQERIELREIRYVSTGDFQINDIRDSQGKHFTNASENDPIPRAFIGSVADDYNNLGILPVPLVVEGGVTLYIDVKDLSAAANTVYLIASGTREYQ